MYVPFLIHIANLNLYKSWQNWKNLDARQMRQSRGHVMDALREFKNV